MITNRSWRLINRPKGTPTLKEFEQREEVIPPLNEGDYLIKVEYISYDPTQRGWMREEPSYMEPVKLGEVMRATGTGIVLQSKNADYPVGTRVSGFMGWQEYLYVTKDTPLLIPIRKLPNEISSPMALNLVGIVGFTAYFGLLDVGKATQGEVVVVSAAAGATGSLVGQIAKLKGNRVIGIAGGQHKCNWLKEIGFDEAIDYKSEDVKKRLSELAPKGINLYFDNVGGNILEAAIDNMALHGRIVACGGISGYNSEPKGPNNWMKIVAKRLTVSGFIVTDFSSQFPKAIGDYIQWVKEGKIKTSEDIQHGFENIPGTLQRLWDGSNIGKVLLKL